MSTSILRLSPGVTAAIILAVLAWPAGASAQECPNETARTQQGSTYLLDCRAYEQVSPVEKNGGDIAAIDGDSNGGVVQATPDGSKITYASIASFGEARGAEVGDQYLAIRTSHGWSTQNITMQAKSFSYFGNGGLQYKAFSPDLTRGILPNVENGEGKRPVEEPPLGGAPAGYPNLYLREFDNESTQALLTSPPEEQIVPYAFEMTFLDATTDLSHIIFQSTSSLVPGAKGGGNNLYEWINGRFYAVNILPGVTSGETDVEGGNANHLGSGNYSGYYDESNMISNNGTRVFWSGNGGGLYVRENVGQPQSPLDSEGKCTVPADACTVQVDAAVGGGTFVTASVDGSRAFYVTGASEGNGDLYEYDLETGGTTDLTSGGSVLGVLGTSADGSYVYFIGNGVMAGTSATPGNCPVGGGSIAQSCNLYVEHNGQTSFIARLSSLDSADWAGSVIRRTARVPPDGLHVVFASAAELTGYDNHDAVTGEPDEEIYEYSVSAAGPSELNCLSCRRGGERPEGSSSLTAGTNFNLQLALYESRSLSADGSRVFFDSDDAIVPSDTNNRGDVYEWESQATGGCVSAGGCVSLISSGTSREGSSFVDASEGGSDVFFVTRSQLVGGDQDELVDLYDAREDGGAAGVVAPVCTGSGCQGVPAAPPVFATPSSVTFEGIGNYVSQPAAKAVVKHKGKKKVAKKKASSKRKKKGRGKTKSGSSRRGVKGDGSGAVMGTNGRGA